MTTDQMPLLSDSQTLWEALGNASYGRDEPTPVEIDLHAGRVLLWIEHLESLACSLHAIEFRPKVLLDLSDDGLREWSRQCIEQITCLDQPLELLEFDHLAPAFLARTRRAIAQGQQSHYELRGDRHAITLEHYHSPVRAPRQRVPFTMTRTMLYQLLTSVMSAT